jgi:hypothetical protein
LAGCKEGFASQRGFAITAPPAGQRQIFKTDTPGRYPDPR